MQTSAKTITNAGQYEGTKSGYLSWCTTSMIVFYSVHLHHLDNWMNLTGLAVTKTGKPVFYYDIIGLESSAVSWGFRLSCAKKAGPPAIYRGSHLKQL